MQWIFEFALILFIKFVLNVSLSIAHVPSPGRNVNPDTPPSKASILLLYLYPPNAFPVVVILYAGMFDDTFDVL